MNSLFWLGTGAKILFIIAIVLTFAPVLIWAERRQSAMMQDRVGPVRAGFNIPLPGGKTFTLTLFGLLHPLADAVKLIWKEDFVPPRADKFLHSIAPLIAMVPSIAVFAVIPFGDVFYPALATNAIAKGADLTGQAGTFLSVASINVGILYIFGVAGCGIVGAALAGYSSDNKFSLLGGIRAASQMVSYEVTLGLSLVGCFMTYNTLLLGNMVHWQQDHAWGILVQPFAFFLFLAASIAEQKRIPFDVPEAESELVAGYFTEYSGMKFGLFFMGEFIEVVASSAILITLFLGGYTLPGLDQQGFYLPMTDHRLADLQHWAVVAMEVGIFIAKLVVVIFLQLQIRWSLPRFRYDQIMKLCWRMLLPASLLNILVTGVLVLYDESHTEQQYAVFPGFFILAVILIIGMFALSRSSKPAAAISPAE